MIPVIKLVQSLRYALKDMQAITYSDFELIEAINQAASLLYTQMSENFVTFAVKKKLVTVDATASIQLPSDFVRIHQVGMGEDGIAIPTSSTPKVEGTYRILGDTFYAPEGVYSLEYYYVPARVKTLADELDAPLSLSSYIEQIALAISGNNLEKAQSIIIMCSNGLKARELSHFNNVGPAQVLGGKI